MACDWGGMPRVIVIDNGTDFGALGQEIDRLSVYGALEPGLRQVKSWPYSPEGKGRIEGAFGIVERSFLKSLEGHIGGDRMKSPTKSKGRAVDPYPHGIERFIAVFNLAIAQYNGTEQGGQLTGLSPKAMLDRKIAETSWRAERPNPEIFDLVFSKDERRNVTKGGVTIVGRVYSGPVLAELPGEKQVPILAPLRDPEGPAIMDDHTIGTGVGSMLRTVTLKVVAGAGLAILRGPVGIGKTHALAQITDELEDTGVAVVSVTESPAISGNINAFLRATSGPSHVDTGSGADAMESAWDMLSGYPFRSWGRRVLLIVDEAQDLSGRVLETIRVLWDRGGRARLGDESSPAFGCVLAGNTTFMTRGGAQRVASFRPLNDR